VMATVATPVVLVQPLHQDQAALPLQPQLYIWQPNQGAGWPVSQSFGPPTNTNTTAISPAASSDEAAVLPPGPPPKLTRMFSEGSGYSQFFWTVDAHKLHGKDTQAVSPPFELFFGPQYPNVKFKMAIYPKVLSNNRGGACFKTAGGRGYIKLKCEDELLEAMANVSFYFSIGDGTAFETPRGPVFHNFLSNSVCGLAKDQEEWDFNTAVHMGSFIVCLEIVTQPDMSSWKPPRSTDSASGV